MRFLAIAIALVLSLFSAASHAWWNEDWTGRKKITLNNPAGEVSDVAAMAGDEVVYCYNRVSLCQERIAQM